MTLRPAVIAASLVGVFAAGAVTTLTHVSAHHATRADNQICVVLAKDAAHQHTQDYCVDWTGALQHN